MRPGLFLAISLCAACFSGAYVHDKVVEKIHGEGEMVREYDEGGHRVFVRRTGSVFQKIELLPSGAYEG